MKPAATARAQTASTRPGNIHAEGSKTRTRHNMAYVHAEPSAPVVDRIAGDAERIDGEKRRMIYEAIVEQPGLHKSELCRRMNLAWGTVAHHLGALRRRGLIRYVKIAGRMHVAPASDVQGHRLSRAMLLPHSKTILDMLSRGPLGPTAIAADLQLGHKLVRSHLEMLVEDGLVETDNAYHPRYWVRHDLR